MKNSLLPAHPEPTGDGASALRSGAKILIDTLVELGVDTLFGYPGGAVLPVYDALYAWPKEQVAAN